MATDLRKYTVQEAVNIGAHGALASVLTADGTVKSTGGTVYSVMVSLNGVQVGDKVEIKDNTTVQLSFVATATAQSWMFDPSVGVNFDHSIVVDVTMSGGGAKEATVTTVYL